MRSNGTSTHGDLVRDGIRRARQRRRVQLVQAQRYPDQIAEAIQPIVTAQAAEAVQLIEDLGGETEATAGQLALVRQAQQAAVVRQTAFHIFLRDGNLTGRAIEKLLAASNVERAALIALGLERRAKPVESLSDYLARSTAAQDAP